jgi:hypothetical protein
MTNELSEILGLKSGMSTYFAHAPAEYFDLLGHKTYTYRPDEDGTYQFIHAFFAEKDQLEASFGILASKLADDGVLWISTPKNSSDIDKNIVLELASLNNLKESIEAEFADWLAFQFVVD